MLKKVNGFINTSISLSVLLFIIGVILIIFPNSSLLIFSYFISASLIIFGTVSLIKAYKGMVGSGMKFTAFVSLLIGIVILLYPQSLIATVPIALGIWMLFSSLPKLEIAFKLKSTKDKKWGVAMTSATLGILCGIFLIIKPNIFAIAITSLIGIILVIYSINDIYNFSIFKGNIKVVHNYFKK